LNDEIEKQINYIKGSKKITIRRINIKNKNKNKNKLEDKKKNFRLKCEIKRKKFNKKK
jgi:hypothetical protein